MDEDDTRPTAMRRRTFLGAGAALSVGAAIGPVGSRAYASENALEQAPPDGDADRYVDVQLMSITDLHGYLSPTDTAGYNVVTDRGEQRVVGGAAYLAAHLKRLRAGRRNSIFFSAGDNFSGWPFTVDSHANEPSVEVLNALGLQFSTVGNHELDQKFPEYLIDHMEKGVPYPVAGRDDAFRDSRGRRFRGADFAFYTANVTWDDTGLTVVPPYNVVHVDAGHGRTLPVGFIHLTISDWSTLSTSFQPGMKPVDQIEAANRVAAKLKVKGVKAIVINIHDGGFAGQDINGLSDPTGPCFELAAKASADISAIVTGHWHVPFNGMLPGPDGVKRPVVEAGCYGQILNEITLKLDRRTGEVAKELTTSLNHPNTHDVPPDPQVQAIVNYWVDQGVKRYTVPLATQSGDLTRARNALGESTLGDLAADVVAWNARSHGDHVDLGVFAQAPRAYAAALNGDGLLRTAGPMPGDRDGRILFGEAWNVYGNGTPVVGVTVTGAQVLQALQDQWQATAHGVSAAPLAVSKDVTYTADLSAEPGKRVDPASVRIGGKPLDVARDYRVALVAFTLLGIDGTSAFTGYRHPVRHDRDREAFIAYLRAHPHVDPPPPTRVRAAGTRTGTGTGTGRKDRRHG